MIFNIILVVTAILLITVILLQNKATGLGAAFGGSGSIAQTKRGAEKGLYLATIILSIIFLTVALLDAIY